jgi:hypothetical protein
MDEDPWILHARQSANCEFLKEFMNSQLLNDIKHTTTLLGTSATINSSTTTTTSATTHASTTTNALVTATASTSATTIEVIHTRVYRESNETTFLRALTSGFSDLPEENADDEIEISEGLLLFYFFALIIVSLSVFVFR